MKLRNLSRRERLIFYLTILIVLAALMINFLIAPSLAKLEEINSQIEKKEFFLKRQFSLINQGENIMSLYENYSQTSEKESSSEEIIAVLFEKINGFANNAKLKIKTIKPLALKQEKEYKKANLEVELEGEFKSIFQFINELEKSALLIKISSLRIVAPRQASQFLSCRLSLSKILF